MRKGFGALGGALLDLLFPAAAFVLIALRTYRLAGQIVDGRFGDAAWVLSQFAGGVAWYVAVMRGAAYLAAHSSTDTWRRIGSLVYAAQFVLTAGFVLLSVWGPWDQLLIVSEGVTVCLCLSMTTESLFLVAGWALRTGRSNLATLLVRSYLNLRPRDVSAWLRWQQLLGSAGLEEERLSALQQATSMNPTQEELLGAAIRTAIYRRELRVASQELKKMRMAYPDSVLPHLLEIELARAQRALERVRPAIDQARGKVRPHREPNFAARLGTAMLDENVAPEEATRLIADAVRWETEDPWAHAIMVFLDPSREREHLISARKRWDPRDGDLDDELEMVRRFLEQRNLIGRFDSA